ncbi:unnamed protein product [Microthlaspi erraticum]|uniref:Uncharacterized protein n=1 Tax=Microthlaspi erraticum TaxID=1685480 RepID=A0A6D2LAP9_9BRAS|nr:unnamed protein product [Microthlaspi erraticum]
MDFIKTGSLRALIKLTFQRKWNGLIWMSRKGVIAEIVKTVQAALSRNRGQAVQSGRPRNECSAVGQIQIHPSKASAKVKFIRLSTHHDPGSNVPQSGKPRPLTTVPRTTMPREPGSNALRLRDLTRVPRPMAPSEPGSHVPRPAEKHGPILHSSDHSGRPRNCPATTAPITTTTRLSGRPSRPTVRMLWST